METVYIGLLFVTALGTNALLGAWRRGLRRFSPGWFVAIHASIPLLVAMRLALIPSNWVIPPEIGLAFVGQFVGARVITPQGGDLAPAPGSTAVEANAPDLHA